jgi:amino-acid N-acetyltransferase
MTADLPPIQPGADLPAVRALLAAAGLPVADLTAAHLDGFWGCGESPDLSGVVGLEIHGTVALLRSLAVAPAWRGQGLGAALLAHAERAARRRGLAALYLLTTTR